MGWDAGEVRWQERSHRTTNRRVARVDLPYLTVETPRQWTRRFSHAQSAFTTDHGFTTTVFCLDRHNFLLIRMVTLLRAPHRSSAGGDPNTLLTCDINRQSPSHRPLTKASTPPPYQKHAPAPQHNAGSINVNTYALRRLE